MRPPSSTRITKGGVVDEGAGEGHLLPLAAGEVDATLEAARQHANDALHLAAASVGGADYALSYDRNHWLRRVGRVATLLGPRPAIMTPDDCL